MSKFSRAIGDVHISASVDMKPEATIGWRVNRFVERRNARTIARRIKLSRKRWSRNGNGRSRAVKGCSRVVDVGNHRRNGGWGRTKIRVTGKGGGRSAARGPRNRSNRRRRNRFVRPTQRRKRFIIRQGVGRRTVRRRKEVNGGVGRRKVVARVTREGVVEVAHFGGDIHDIVVVGGVIFSGEVRIINGRNTRTGGGSRKRCVTSVFEMVESN
jgi:hypothetical protein